MHQVIYHRLIQRDIHSALDYYDGEGGRTLGNRFFVDVEAVIKSIEKNPKGHHFSDGGLRRASLKSFPYHVLYDVEGDVIWIAVLRYDRRHPSFGLRRKKW